MEAIASAPPGLAPSLASVPRILAPHGRNRVASLMTARTSSRGQRQKAKQATSDLADLSRLSKSMTIRSVRARSLRVW